MTNITAASYPRLFKQGHTAKACWNLVVQEISDVSSLSFLSSVTLSTFSMFVTK